MKIQDRARLKRGRELHAEICNIRPLPSISLCHEDITALKAFLTIGDWFDAQKLAAKQGQKGAVAVLHGVTIFQKD